MKTTGIHDFTVIQFAAETVKGVSFRAEAGKKLRIMHSSVSKIDADNPSAAWKDVFRSLSSPRDGLLILSGALSDGVFFRCLSAPLAPKLLRSALELELPRRVLKVPEDVQMQFCAAGSVSEGEIPVNVYSFRGSALERLAARITQSVRKADFYIYPFLAASMDSPPLFLPEIEPDFFFDRGEWRPASAFDAASAAAAWNRRFDSEFDSEPGFDRKEFFGCLVTAEFAASEQFRAWRHGFDILPKRLKPSRLRAQITLAAVLAGLLLGIWIWGEAGELARNYRTYTKLTADRNALLSRVRSAQGRIKAIEKDLREYQRLANLSAGEHELMEKLADISRVMPSNVTAANFRMADGSLEMLLRSEAESLNIPNTFRPLEYWKVGSVNQFRRNDDSVTTINLKLVPAENSK